MISREVHGKKQDGTIVKLIIKGESVSQSSKDNPNDWTGGMMTIETDDGFHCNVVDSNKVELLNTKEVITIEGIALR